MLFRSGAFGDGCATGRACGEVGGQAGRAAAAVSGVRTGRAAAAGRAWGGGIGDRQGQRRLVAGLGRALVRRPVRGQVVREQFMTCGRLFFLQAWE